LRLKSSFYKFYARYNDFVIANYHWPICWMNCFILFVRLCVGVTGQKRMLTSSRHLILPSHFSWAQVALHSVLYFSFRIMIAFYTWWVVHEIDFTWQSYLSCIVDGIRTFALYLEAFWWKFLVNPNYFISP
jgi:hypothetical protein